MSGQALGDNGTSSGCGGARIGIRVEPTNEQETLASLGPRIRKQGRTRIDKRREGSACATGLSEKI
jgi:hypothetical protein